MALRRFLPGAILVLFLLFNLASNAQVYMFGRADFPVGNSPAGIVYADFNGDGILDLAVTNTYDNTVSVLLGLPNGTFAPQVSYATGQAPAAIVVGDFNSDGNLDLAVANANCVPGGPSQPLQCTPSTVGILLGNGDGTFQPQTTDAVGTLPASIVTADFNGDGKPDLAVVNFYDNTISVLLGNGDGTFQTQVTYAVSLGDSEEFVLPANSLVVGDFNGDGKTDLAVAGSGAVMVLLGSGNGTFQSALTTTCSSCGQAMAAGDFNGDGKLDLAVTGGGGSTTVLLGLGNGMFSLNATYATGNGTEVAVADLRGNGKLDLVITQGVFNDNPYGGSFAVQLGNGDGTFQTPAFYGTNSLAYGVILADVNGDGQFDAVITNTVLTPISGGKPSFPGSVSIVLGFGDGTFVGGTDYITSGGIGSILSADFTNNGNLDLAVILPSMIDLTLGTGNGTFNPFRSLPTAQTPFAIAAGDLRNNGEVDLVSANNPCNSISNCNPGTASVLLNNGNGTFQTHVDYPAGFQPYGVALGSFRNNGTLDIAVSNNAANTVSILLGNGDGTFQSPVPYPTGAYPDQIAVGDFNQDGNLDLAVATENGGTSVLLGNGDGTFKAQVSYGPGAQSIIAADFNGDGNLDLAVDNGNGPVAILLGNGDGTFQQPITLSFAGGGFAVADFNGDSKLDLLTAEPAGGGDEILALGNGDGTFQAPLTYLLGPVPQTTVSGQTVGDFNGDGAPDLAASFAGPSAGISVMLSTAFKAISPTGLSFGYQGVSTISPPQTVTFSNPSNVKFSIASIAVSGNFAQTNTCGATLAPGENCAITVTFSPTGTGQESGTLTITDSTRVSKVSVGLSGTGVNGSYLTAYPYRRNFSPQLVGATSASSAIQLANTGNQSLSITGISITGTDAGDFSQTNNCGATLPAGSNCLAQITFTPQAIGSRSATLSVADSAPGSPQTAFLSGVGLGPLPSFSIGAASGSATSQTISAGQSASFSLALAQVGSFTGTVNLSCSITPVVTPASTCNLSSSSVQVTGSAAPTVTATVETTGPSTSAGWFPAVPPAGLPRAWTFTLLGAAGLFVAARRRRAAWGGLAMLLVCLSVSCGGNGSSSSHTSPGTPAGTYTATVTATSGNLTQTMALQVVVQ
jgi:FG-GAP-like repeat